MGNKVVRVSDYLKTDNGFAHDVVRRTAKEESALLKKQESDKKKAEEKAKADAKRNQS